MPRFIMQLWLPETTLVSPRGAVSKGPGLWCSPSQAATSCCWERQAATSSGLCKGRVSANSLCAAQHRPRSLDGNGGCREAVQARIAEHVVVVSATVCGH